MRPPHASQLRWIIVISPSRSAVIDQPEGHPLERPPHARDGLIGLEAAVEGGVVPAGRADQWEDLEILADGLVGVGIDLHLDVGVLLLHGRRGGEGVVDGAANQVEVDLAGGAAGGT
jgi:hypothetical protein